VRVEERPDGDQQCDEGPHPAARSAARRLQYQLLNFSGDGLGVLL